MFRSFVIILVLALINGYPDFNGERTRKSDR